MKPNADECTKLLDAGWTLQIFRNQLGSYTACAIPPKLQAAIDAGEDVVLPTDELDEDDDTPDPCTRWLTDDFTPTRAIHRLVEKALFNRIVGVDTDEWSD